MIIPIHLPPRQRFPEERLRASRLLRITNVYFNKKLLLLLYFYSTHLRTCNCTYKYCCEKNHIILVLVLNSHIKVFTILK